MNDRFLLLIVVLVVIGIGLGAGCAGVVQKGLEAITGDDWTPRGYVPAPGDCIVYPQGDPLYDEHYAKNVNVPNCEAQVNQSQAGLIDAQAESIQADTARENIATRAAVFSFAGVVLFLVIIGIVILIGR